MSDWAKVKSSSDVALDGVAVSIERRDGAFHSVTVTDGSGGWLKVALGQYSSLDVMVKAKPEIRKVTDVSGVIADVPVSVTIEGDKSDYAVTSKVREMECAGVSSVVVTERDEEIPF